MTPSAVFPSGAGALAGTTFERIILGESVEGRSIEAFVFGSSGDPVLILGGTHGDEPKSVYAARQLIDVLLADPGLAAGRHVTVVPVVNPDGYERRRRRNVNGVDLNRNFATADWAVSKRHSRYYGGPSAASEPETQLVAELVERLQPLRILSIHSIGKRKFCNNYNGPAADLAELMHASNGYRVAPDIGYPTPGSFGTWAGFERQIPTITLELPSHDSRERCWKDNREAILAFIRGS
ncbi:MAG: murein peptide amidase A [bacterium]|nr:murein peptide amidase A [bacterium]